MVRRTIRKIFELENERPLALSVTYVTDAQIKRLNLEYRASNRATDVLAFSAQEGRKIEGCRGYLGDIIISIDAAGRQAKRFGYTKKKELKLYLIHGVLHLFGYDDESGAKKKDKMRKRQEELLDKV